MTRQTTIQLEEGGTRRSLQLEKITDQYVADLVQWGFGKNLTEIVRHALRIIWEQQRAIRMEENETTRKIYTGDDRVEQVNWLEREADTITYYGEGTAQELVDYWWEQHQAGEFDVPQWFDEADRRLLVIAVDTMLNS